MEPVCIVETGLANIASMEASLRRLGVSTRRTRDPEEVRRSDRTVLPGVGSFGAAMPFLERTGLAASIKERVHNDRPTLAICLGMQLLSEGSEEAQGVDGLGCISGRATRLPEDRQVPQLGWNRVEPSPACRMLTAGYAYFANSYCIESPPEGWETARTTYGVRMVSAIERGDVLACQFHPELSGPWGSELLGRWLQGGTSC